MAKDSFISLLKRRGYQVKSEKLGGGFVNDVTRVTAEKDGKITEYVLKRYGSDEDMKSMLRGYDLISGKIKTPAIVYHNAETREVAYDLVNGKSVKSLIEKGDPKAIEAVYKLGEEIQKLHEIREFNLRYPKNDSPDEIKMRKTAIKVFNKGRINLGELQRIQRALREYIPKKKRIIHGDAHLGNFLYTDSGELYMIDTDNVIVSDPDADLGKIVESIEQLEQEGKISESSSTSLTQLFFDMHHGEEQEAIFLYQLRTPLIRAKNDDKTASHRIRKLLEKAHFRSLEARVAACMFAAFLVFFLIRSPISGFAVLENEPASSILNSTLLITILGLLVYFIYKKNKTK